MLGPGPGSTVRCDRLHTAASAINTGMAADDAPLIPLPEIQVCCLACGVRYRKPLSGTVVNSNPGCPACGYLGWALDADASPPFATDEPRPAA